MSDKDEHKSEGEAWPAAGPRHLAKETLKGWFGTANILLRLCLDMEPAASLILLWGKQLFIHAPSVLCGCIKATWDRHQIWRWVSNAVRWEFCLPHCKYRSLWDKACNVAQQPEVKIPVTNHIHVYRTRENTWMQLSFMLLSHHLGKTKLLCNDYTLVHKPTHESSLLDIIIKCNTNYMSHNHRYPASELTCLEGGYLNQTGRNSSMPEGSGYRQKFSLGPGEWHLDPCTLTVKHGGPTRTILGKHNTNPTAMGSGWVLVLKYTWHVGFGHTPSLVWVRGQSER